MISLQGNCPFFKGFGYFQTAIFNMPDNQIEILVQICNLIVESAIDWTQSGIDKDRALECLINVNYFLFLKGLLLPGYLT